MKTSAPPGTAVDMPKVVFYVTAIWGIASGLVARLLPDLASLAETPSLSSLFIPSLYVTLVALPAPVLVGWYLGLRGGDEWLRASILVLITGLVPVAWLWLGATLIAPEVPNSPLSRGLRTLRARAAGHPL